MIGKVLDKKRAFTAMCRDVVVASVLMGLLNACVGASDLLSQASAQGSQPDTKVVKVAGVGVTLGRAAGYCFNDAQSRFSTSGAFVIMGPCDPKDLNSSAKGLAIVNVLAESGVKDAIKAHTLEDYFQSDAGRAALSRKGKAKNLQVLGTMQDKGIVYVHTRDGDGPIIPDTTNEQWRVFFVVNDRLVSVSVINFVDNLMPDGIVFAQMEEIAFRIKALNP